MLHSTDQGESGEITLGHPSKAIQARLAVFTALTSDPLNKQPAHQALGNVHCCWTLIGDIPMEWTLVTVSTAGH